MGLKYSINSAGRIVAERDIYSLGGFIPKGSLGGAIKDETQLSQEGECWLAGGDMSIRPDVRIKDNAYIGIFTGTTETHTDGITEFSGNTLIPGSIIVRNPIADPVNNFYAKDSFIGISMNVLCGPESTTTAFPFGQGVYNNDAAKGTLFENMVVTPIPINICRAFADLRLGKDTYLYIPTGYNCRVLWAYYDTSNKLAYSGESTAFAAGLHKLSHPVYKVARMHIAKANGTAMTPTDLLATGAKILGHISGSVKTDIRPESASGEYVMVNSSLIAETDNFGLAATQLRFLAGGLYNTNMYTSVIQSDRALFGTFHNVERLDYIKYMGDFWRPKVNRDIFVSAYDCPLLRIHDDTFGSALADAGGVTLRRCIAPKVEFQDDIINGNTYEDIDFSYTNEALGTIMTGYTRFISSHRQGIYRLSGGLSSTGYVSYKGNLSDTARLYQAEEYIPLDGDIIEQGSYVGTFDAYYEDSKNTAANRVRTGKPLPTFGAVFPAAPSGFKVTFIVYLREDFKIQASQVNPTTIETANPYFVVVFGKADDSPVTPSEFIALNRTLRMIDHTKAPEITGSAYVGAGCTVRGDVQLHGDPYVNRVFDVNMWERGFAIPVAGKGYEESFTDTGTTPIRFRLKHLVPVETGASITCADGYQFYAWYFDENGNYKNAASGWVKSVTIPDNVSYIGAVIGTSTTSFIEDSDIPLANVKYLRAFKKRRYITNELDRKSPEDVFLTEDQWRVAAISTGEAYVGRIYDTLISSSTKYCILKRPINAGASWTVTLPDGVDNVYTPYNSSWDALTKLLGLGVKANAALTGLELKKVSNENVTLKDVPAARFIVEFVPQTRIIVPYGSNTLFISGPKIRMYDNSVLSRNFSHDADIVLQGDAVMGYDFASGDCLCSNGHDDAIIKLP